MKHPTLSPQEDRARITLGLLMGILNLTDKDVAERTGLSRQSVQQRRTGLTKMRLGDVDQMADALGVSALLFSLPPVEALRFVADNHSELVVSMWRWFCDSAYN